MRCLRCLRIVLLLTIALAACAGSTPSPTPVSPPTTSAPPTNPPAPTATALPAASLTAIPVQPVIGMPEGTDGFPWWNDTVFYEIFVRSFYDSNADGIGDFNGLTAKLDYLNDGDPNTTADLGVTGLWLMPIHPTASYHGYDVTDFNTVNPEYGTLEDFKRLLDEAHKRGIRIIIDLVLNHTSSQHPWFEAAQDPNSPYRDWYLWSEAKPTAGGWHPSSRGDYYYGQFWEGMPDLNYTNPAITAEMQKVVSFWLNDMGVDGFRLDAAKFLIEVGTLQSNSDQTHAWFRDFRPFYKELAPQALMVGEIWEGSVTVGKYIAGDELDLAFDFDLAKAFVASAGLRNANQVNTILPRDARLFRPGQFATFLTNHDQDRAMSVFGDNVDKAKGAVVLLLTAPGVPFIYYGEEVGMLGKKPDEDLRLPMQWTADSNGGFTTGTPWRVLNADFLTKNVAAQTDDPDSLLSFYRQLIRIRNEHAALRVGDFYLVDTGSNTVFASLRATNDEAVLIVINLGQNPVSDYKLSLDNGPLAGAYAVTPILGSVEFAAPTINAQGGFEGYQPLPELRGYSQFILQLQP